MLQLVEHLCRGVMGWGLVHLVEHLCRRMVGMGPQALMTLIDALGVLALLAGVACWLG